MSKKTGIELYIKETQASLREYVQSAGAGRLLLQLDRITNVGDVAK